jgi:hypothetical protein
LTTDNCFSISRYVPFRRGWANSPDAVGVASSFGAVCHPPTPDPCNVDPDDSSLLCILFHDPSTCADAPSTCARQTRSRRQCSKHDTATLIYGGDQSRSLEMQHHQEPKIWRYAGLGLRADSTACCGCTPFYGHDASMKKRRERPIAKPSTTCTAPFHRASHSTAKLAYSIRRCARAADHPSTLLLQLRVRRGCTNTDSGIACATLWLRQTAMGSHAAVGVSYMATWRLGLPATFERGCAIVES